MTEHQRLLAAVRGAMSELRGVSPGPWRMHHDADGKEIVDRDGAPVALALADADRSGGMATGKAILYALSDLDFAVRALTTGQATPGAIDVVAAHWNSAHLPPLPWRIETDPQHVLVDASGGLIALLDGDHQVANGNVVAIASTYIPRILAELTPSSARP